MRIGLVGFGSRFDTDDPATLERGPEGGLTHEPDGTEQAVVVHRGGLHLRFVPAPTRDDVGHPLVVAAGEQSVVQRARHPNRHRVVAGAQVLGDVDNRR